MSVPSLCHEVSGDFIIEVVGLGSVVFLNIPRYSLQLAVLRVYRQFKTRAPDQLVPRFIHLIEGRGMHHYKLQMI